MLIEQTNDVGRFVVYQAASPAGPWRRIMSGTVPAAIKGITFTRAIIGHPDLSTGSELLISFFDPSAAPCCNRREGQKGHVMVASFPWQDQSARSAVRIGLADIPARSLPRVGSEDVRVLLRWAFDTLDLNRVQAETDTRNVASARVLEKLGFVREGTVREDCVVNGEASDSWVYGLIRREWRPSSEPVPVR